jgi:formylglycine-generating enzyme required for sulfatase activity
MSNARAAFLFLVFVRLFAAAPAHAQGGTPPPPTPTPTFPEVVGLCTTGSEKCIPAAVMHYPWPALLVALVALLALAAVGRGLLKWLESLGERAPAGLWALVRRRDPVRYYLRNFISDFEDPKYQPFTGDDVRKPKLEKIYLSLDLRPDAVSGDDETKTSREKELGERLMGRAMESRVSLADAARRSKKHLALVGGAGCGKSTFLQWTGLACAKDCARNKLDEGQREIVWTLSKTTQPRWAFRVMRWLRLSRPLFPVFVPLGEFDQYCRDPRDPIQPDKKLDGPLPPNAENLLRFACWRFNRRHQDYSAVFAPDYLKGKLRAGCLLLFDGVDEVAFERRELIRQAIGGLLREDYLSPRTRVLLTSRPPGYAREAWSDDFLRCEVLPMTTRQRDTLIRALFHTIYTNQDKAEEKSEALIESLDEKSDERVREMAQTPLLATIFAKLQHNNYRLPDQRARVYKEAVELILDEVYRRDDVERPAAAPDTGDSGQRLTWLSRLAFELHRAGVGEAGMIRHDLIDAASQGVPEAERPALADRLRAFIHTIAKNACLLEETQENHYGFRSHRSFQEYLAGRYLVKEYAPYDLDKLARFVREAVASLNHDQWEEPLRLAVGFLAIDANEQVKVFLEMLHTLSHGLTDPEQADWLRAVTVLALFDLPEERLKNRTALQTHIIESGLETFVRPDLPLRDSLVAELGLALARTGDARLAQPLCDKLTANPPVIKRPTQRRAIGLALGAVGDPRFPQTPLLPGREKGVGDEGRLPALVTIPSGPFRMGTSPAEAEQLKAQDVETWDDEKPQHTVFVSEFAIGKYPVTNAEYRLFWEAKGYENKDYWGDDGWRWRTGQLEADLSIYSKDFRKQVEDWLKRRPFEKRQQPFFWDEADFNQPNQPVVGVTWYEAEAYCKWLSAVTGQNFRLPTEAQWEKAARFTPSPFQGEGRGEGQMRLWPWGDEWEANKCNSRESGFNATTPVGMYPDGAWPGGPLDMVGNVWEWCGDWWAADLYSQRADKEVRDPTGPASGSARVLRGGAWNNIRRDCRAAYRDWDVPAVFSYLIGFRLVGSPVRS